MDDDTLLRTMKNGLMIAGHEMGTVGDHWPAINTISAGLHEEFETIQRDEVVLGELEFHIADTLHKIEEDLPQYSPEGQKEMRALLREMWERFYAIFEAVAPSNTPDPNDLLDDEQKQSFKSFNASLHILSRMGGRA